MGKQRATETSSLNSELKLRGFKVCTFDSNTGGLSYSRKDFYKINITTGRFLFHYADRSIETDDLFLFFGNPRVPYSCELLSERAFGYTCLFTEAFLQQTDRSESLLHSPLFALGGTPVFSLTQEQAGTFLSLLRRMESEQDSDYAYKDELLRNYIQLFIHEALKMQPAESAIPHKSAATRITNVFLELLERQFPIESTEQPLMLRSAQDYAKELSIHVNYLNSSVKEVTGKPTSVHIADRITAEAKALLLHTDWNIAEIAFALDFQYPTYFNNFFRKKTGLIPKAVRAASL